MLSERKVSQKVTYQMIPFMYFSKDKTIVTEKKINGCQWLRLGVLKRDSMICKKVSSENSTHFKYRRREQEDTCVYIRSKH